MKLGSNGKSEECLICKDVIPPGSSFPQVSGKLAALRSAKSSSGTVRKVDWIKCDSCKKWCHSVCCGLSRKEYTKLSKDTQFFKCVICCLKAVPELGRKYCLEILDNTKLGLSDLHTSTNSHNDSPSIAAAISPLLEVRRSALSIPSTPPVSENITNNFDSSVLESCVVEKKDVLIDSNSNINKILLVDNISNPLQFSSSRSILKELNNYFPHIKVDFAYSLSRGGVAIHVTCKSDRDYLIDSLPKESFGGGVKHPPKGKGESTFFIKGVDTSVDVCCLNDFFSNKGIQITEIRRLTKRHTGKPTRVVKIKCNHNSSEQLLSAKVVVNGRVCCVEKEKVKVFRCYNCQKLGHIARNCREVTRCEFCADTHNSFQVCCRNVQCHNCGGPHISSYSKCPAYIARYEALTVQHSEH